MPWCPELDAELPDDVYPYRQQIAGLWNDCRLEFAGINLLSRYWPAAVFRSRKWIAEYRREQALGIERKEREEERRLAQESRQRLANELLREEIERQRQREERVRKIGEAAAAQFMERKAVASGLRAGWLAARDAKRQSDAAEADRLCRTVHGRAAYVSSRAVRGFDDGEWYAGSAENFHVLMPADEVGLYEELH